MSQRRTHRVPTSRWLQLVAVLACFLMLGACGDVLDVTDPDIIEPGSLDNELGVTARANGAIGDFNLAVAGGGDTDGIVMFAGLLTDEWDHSGTYVGRQSAEARDVREDSNELLTLFQNLHIARNAAEEAAVRIAAVNPTSSRVSEMLTYAGFTYVAFAESFCNGVPFSKEVEGELQFGDPETRVEMIARAVDRLSDALADANRSSDIDAMASVLLARAMLSDDNPDYSGAAALVSGVGTEYVHLSEHSNVANRNRNNIFQLNQTVERYTVADLNGGNGLPFLSSGDPRVPWLHVGTGFDGSTQQYNLLLYAAREDPVRIVSGLEARLIEAEWALQDGRIGDMITILQDLRTWGEDNLGYPLITGATDFDFSQIDLAFSLPVEDFGSNGVVDTEDEELLFQERAYWLFSTGHRLGDMRRMIREYGREAEEIFPVGIHPKGFLRGTDVNLPVPEQEGNNPAFNLAGAECLDRLP